MIAGDPAARGWGGAERRAPLPAIVVADLRSGWNRLQARTRTPMRLVGYLAVLVVLASLAGGLTYGIGFSLGMASGGVSAGLLTSALTGYAVLTLVLGLSSVVTAFFLGRELALLSLAPIHVLVIFAARLLVALRTNAALGLVLLIGLAGFGTARGAGPGFFLLGAAVAVLLPLGTAALQLLVLAVVVRAVPPRLTREIANVAGAFLTAVLYVGWLVLTHAGGGRLGGLAPTRSVLARLASVGRDVSWLPTAWPARALADAAAGSWVAAAPWLLFTLSLTAALVGGAFAAYRGALVTGMGAMTEAGPRRQSRRRSTAVGGAGAAPATLPALLAGLGPPPPVPGAHRPRRARLDRAMAVKDWRSLRRDVRRLGRLLPALVVAFAYPAIAVPSLHLGGRAGLAFWEGVAVTPFVPFLLAEVLAVPAVPLEGRAIQLLRQSPVGVAALVRAKIVATAIPVAGLSCAIALAIGLIRRGNAADLACLVLGILWLSVGLVATAVGAGAAAPNYGAADPRRAVRGIGLLVANLVGLGFVAVSLAAGAYLLVLLRVPGAHRLASVLPGLGGAQGLRPVALLIPLALLALGALAVLSVVGTGVHRLRVWEPAIGDGSR